MFENILVDYLQMYNTALNIQSFFIIYLYIAARCFKPFFVLLRRNL